MKKFLIALLSVLCIVCGALAVACNKSPKYYVLTYDNVSGVRLSFTGNEDADYIESGAEIKEGFKVEFELILSANAEGTPVVKANDTTLTEGDDGKYSFTMKADTHISVTGVTLSNEYEVKFDKGDNRITYLGADGKELESVTVTQGGSVSFKLDISVYYGDSSYTVLSNYTIITPDKNGVYTIENVTDNINVTVLGLTLDEGFTDRENGGSGTADDPYKIERPVDLYYMADLVADSMYQGRYAIAYYEMLCDIDMRGEQIFIIGDGTTDISIFAGNFNGNGHKISNFYISDTIIEQANYTEVFMPYIGLFGLVSATEYGSPRIYDLNIENFTIDVNATSTGEDYFTVGGIVGYGSGVEIVNCTANGKITAATDINTPGYVGGIAGYIQSYYYADYLQFSSGINGCYASVDISNSGYVYASGGIVGELMTYIETTPSYIVNCRADGEVTGSVSAGGIAGRLNANASIVNSCYTGAYIGAQNYIGQILGGEEYTYAYAGGIVGYEYYDAVIANCFAVGTTYADALSSSYGKYGPITGGISTGGSNVNTNAGIVINCKSSADSASFGKDYLVNTLGWSESDWDFSGQYPMPIQGGTASVEITFALCGNGAVTNESTVNINRYAPVAVLYGEEISEYINGDGDMRSYGYYFDADLTQKVPCGYVPTGAVTLYYALVDYSEVYGTYYSQTGSGSDEYFVLGKDGVLEYRNGAINYTSHYSYDGSKIILYNCPVFVEYYTDNDGNVVGYEYCPALAIPDNGLLTMYNNATYTAANPITALKKNENFVYGSYYYSADGGIVEYVFNEDGTGYTGSTNFTYTVNGSQLVISGGVTGVIDDNGYVVSVGSNALTPYDLFRGTWEKSAASHKTFTFDGIGQWTYLEYGYDSEGNLVEISRDGGSYTVTDGIAKLTGGSVYTNVTVGEDGQGFLTVNFGDYTETYYKEYSYVGNWKFFNLKETIELGFTGITSEGYGTVTASYSTDNAVYELTYQSVVTSTDNYIVLYYQDVLFATLRYDTKNGTLTGQIYSVRSAAMTVATFCLYDEYKGEWISEELGIVEFNGLGSYKLSGTVNYLKTEGTVKVNNISAGSYTLEGSTLKGSFVYGGVTYNISYNEATGLVDVTWSGEDETFSDTLYRLDGWQELVLVNEDGDTVYTFNGGGNLALGGTLTAETDGEKEVYRYKPTDGYNAVIYDGEGTEYGTLTASAECFTLALENNSVKLYVQNEFGGEWISNGGEKIIIGAIGGNLTATGSVFGIEVTFSYNFSDDANGGYLSYTTGGETSYIALLGAAGFYELAVASSPDLAGGYEICIREDKLDIYMGEYVAADGSKLVLDGFGNSFFGAGSATLTDKDGKVAAVYSYTLVDAADMPVFRLDSSKYLFKAVSADTQGAFVKDGQGYLLMAPDKLYGISASYNSGSATLTYTFDGLGTVVCEQTGAEYSYTIEDTDTLNREITIKFEDGDTSFTMVLDYGTTDYKLTLVEQDD